MREQTIQAARYAFFNHPIGLIVPEVGLLFQKFDDEEV